MARSDLRSSGNRSCARSRRPRALHLPDDPGILAGYLSVRPDHVYEVEGPWWNERWVRPRLCGEWFVDFWDFDTYRAWPDGSLSYGISDGFPFEAEGFAQLASGSFALHGVLFTVEPIDPTDRPIEWSAHYYFHMPAKRRCGSEPTARMIAGN